jgi:uncharacterized protein (TIGR02996 family)
MSTDRDAFLAAIIAEPDEDTPRLALADWLDEHGDPARAEFIRVQVELARLPPGDPRRVVLEDRADDLLAEHEFAWLGATEERLVYWRWNRGFVEEVGIGPHPTLEPARGQFERHPVRAVAFGTICWNLADLVESPFLERMERLTFDVGSEPGDRGILLDFLASPRLGRLADLDVSMGPTGGLLAELAKRPGVSPLREVELDRLTVADAKAVLTAPRFAELTGLGAFDGPAQGALTTLLRSPERWLKLGLGFAELPRAKLLGLASCTRLQELVVRWPADGKPLPLPASLERLTVESVLDQGPHPGVVARSLGGARLHHLEYRWEPGSRSVGPAEWAGLAELLTAMPGPVLDLSLQSFAADPFPELVRLPGLGNIRRLSLSICPTTEAGIDALAACTTLTGLRELEVELHWNADHVDRIAGAEWLAGLRELSFRGPVIGDIGAVALIRSPRLKRLQRLTMSSAGISAATIKALAMWPGLTRLRSLELYFNYLTPQAMRPLGDRFGPRLRY